MEELVNTDCFLCQKPNCYLKCPKPTCYIYFCCDAHYSAHIVQRRKIAANLVSTEILTDEALKTTKSYQMENVGGNTSDAEMINNPRIGEDSKDNNSVSKYSCLPYRVSTDKKRGRHFIATRNIQPLELILVDAAGVVGPATKTTPVCLACLNPASKQVRFVYNAY